MEIPPPNHKTQNAEHGVGPLISIIIIVTVIVLGGIYFLVTKELGRQTTPPAGADQASL